MCDGCFAYFIILLQVCQHIKWFKTIEADFYRIYSHGISVSVVYENTPLTPADTCSGHTKLFFDSYIVYIIILSSCISRIHVDIFPKISTVLSLISNSISSEKMIIISSFLLLDVTV